MSTHSHVFPRMMSEGEMHMLLLSNMRTKTKNFRLKGNNFDISESEIRFPSILKFSNVLVERNKVKNYVFSILSISK